ncbi:SulP family inorganic anion transporter [candidate division WWE3 bacterium]|nr:SulP family inorganic anion transporter [candidate division WWE3 bacterium]
MNTIIKRITENWKSGITVALVSIPLSISLAVASQAGPVAGIITAIWAGLITSFFGGSNFNIVGPTGALSGILAAYAIAHGANALPMLAIVSGILILIAYVLKLEKYLIYIPSSAIQGFTLGVAFIIAFNQTNFALGLSGLKTHEKFIDNLTESFLHISNSSLLTFAVFLIFLIGLFILLKVLPRIPGAIILSPIGILLGFMTSTGRLPFTLQTLETKFGNLSLHLFNTPTMTFSTTIIMPAITVAVVAILETMISAKIADGMTKTKHNKRKEMFGLGLANIASGICGGIPATAALARTSLNIKSGASDKMSATISSISIALISTILLGYFKYIPMAVIAAILVFVALRMIEFHHIVRMWRLDKISFFLTVAVAFVTIYEDPIIGILFGTAAALITLVHSLSHGQFSVVTKDHQLNHTHIMSDEHLSSAKHTHHTLVYSIKGQLTYVNSQSHIHRFEEKLKSYQNVVLRLSELAVIDIDGVSALDEIIEEITRQGKVVLITGVNPFVSRLLEHSDEFKRLEKEHLVFKRVSEAVTYLKNKKSNHKKHPKKASKK